MLQLGTRVLPRAIVLLAVEGAERGKCMRLHKGTQPSARRIDVCETKRTHRSCTILAVATIERSAANAGVAVGAHDDYVALASTCQGCTNCIVVVIPLLIRCRRDGRVS